MSKENVNEGALFGTLMRLAQLRRESVDPMLLRSSLRNLIEQNKKLKEIFAKLADERGWPAPIWDAKPDAGRLPCLVYSSSGNFGVITARQGRGAWAVTWCDAEAQKFVEEQVEAFQPGCQFLRLRMTSPFVVSESPSFQLVWTEIWAHKRLLSDVAAGC